MADRGHPDDHYLTVEDVDLLSSWSTAACLMLLDLMHAETTDNDDDRAALIDRVSTVTHEALFGMPRGREVAAACGLRSTPKGNGHGEIGERLTSAAGILLVLTSTPKSPSDRHEAIAMSLAATASLLRPDGVEPVRLGISARRWLRPIAAAVWLPSLLSEAMPETACVAWSELCHRLVAAERRHIIRCGEEAGARYSAWQSASGAANNALAAFSGNSPAEEAMRGVAGVVLAATTAIATASAKTKAA